MTHTKEHYERIIAEAQAWLEALKKNKPLEYGEAYYCLNTEGKAFSTRWDNHFVDHKRIEIGNAFRTKEAAEEYAKWRKLHVKMMRASDGFVAGQLNYSCDWSAYGDVCLDFMRIARKPNVPYFRTREAAQKAVDEMLGNDAEFYLTYSGEVV